MNVSVGVAVVLALLILKTSAKTTTSPCLEETCDSPCSLAYDAQNPNGCPIGCNCPRATQQTGSNTTPNCMTMPNFHIWCYMICGEGLGECPTACVCETAKGPYYYFPPQSGCTYTTCPGGTTTFEYGPFGCHSNCYFPTEATSSPTLCSSSLQPTPYTARSCPPLDCGCHMVCDKGPDECPTICECIADINSNTNPTLNPCKSFTCATECQLEYANGTHQCPTGCLCPPGGNGLICPAPMPFCPAGCELQYPFGPDSCPTGCLCDTEIPSTFPTFEPTNCKFHTCNVGCFDVCDGDLGECPTSCTCVAEDNIFGIPSPHPGCPQIYCAAGCINTYEFRPEGCYAKCQCPSEQTTNACNYYPSTTPFTAKNPCPPLECGCLVVYEFGPDGCPTGCHCQNATASTIPVGHQTYPPGVTPPSSTPPMFCPPPPCPVGCKFEMLLQDNGPYECATRCICATDLIGVCNSMSCDFSCNTFYENGDCPISTCQCSSGTNTPNCQPPTCLYGCTLVGDGRCPTGTQGSIAINASIWDPSVMYCPMNTCPTGCQQVWEDAVYPCPTGCKCPTDFNSTTTHTTTTSCPMVSCPTGCQPVYRNGQVKCPTGCKCTTSLDSFFAIYSLYC